MDMDLTLLLLVTLVPATVLAGVIAYALRSREEEIVVAVSGFVVVRD
jgi:hypothetical protein